jgi:glycyl-tRNA synthetase
MSSLLPSRIRYSCHRLSVALVPVTYARSFSSSHIAFRFQLNLPHHQQPAASNPAMAPEMTTLKGKPLNRAEVDGLLRRCLFYTPAFEIYANAPAGFYDLGPPGCGINSNIINLWRKHFVLEENMLEVE